MLMSGALSGVVVWGLAIKAILGFGFGLGFEVGILFMMRK
jgi:hypothetical protein